MKDKIKSLLIHNDTIKNKTIGMIVEEENLLKQTQEFFKKIPKEILHKGIVFEAEDNNANYAVAYEKENFIILAKNGSQKSAKLYGNWDEALINAKKFLFKQKNSQGKIKIVPTK